MPKLGFRHSEDTRKRMSESHKGKPLSEAHRATLFGNKRRLGIKHRPEVIARMSETRKGNRNGNWRGGSTPINRLIRESRELKEWRKKVYDRDGYKCVWCGSRGVLNADHIKPFALFPELRFDIENGRTLCVPCHRKTDTYAGRIKSYDR